MKNFKLLLVLILGLFVFQACNDDETAKEGEIEGKWNITDLTFDITLNGEDLSELFTDVEAEQFEQLLTASFESTFGGSTIEFKSDGSYSSEASDGSSETGTWSINSDGSAMTLDGGTAEEFTFDIVTSTKSSLVLNYTETESGDFDFDGTSDEISTSVNLTLSK